jgi:hypothetical protein
VIKINNIYVLDNEDILDIYIREEERRNRRYNKELSENFGERSEDDD